MTKISISLVSFGLCVVIASCVSGPRGASAPSDAYNSEYVKAEDRFLIRLSNKSGRDLCLWEAVWPNEKGWTGYVQGSPYVSVGQMKFEYQKKFSAIGHSRNNIRILPGEDLAAELLYSDFAMFDTGAEFELVHDLKPFNC